MKEANRLHCPSLDFSMYVYMLERNIEMFQTDKTSQVPPSSPMLDAWGNPSLTICLNFYNYISCHG